MCAPRPRTASGSTSGICPCFGRPARLVWLKRRWRCVDPDCAAKTWTEGTEHVAPRAVLTLRAGAEATRQVGELALPVAVVARELGVCWWTVMDAVVLHGTPLVEDPKRVKKVRALGIDETSFLSATREHRTIYVTGLVDLNRKRIIDLVEGNAATDLRRWCADQDPAWMRAIRVVATDLAESYRSGTSPHLDHADPRGRPFPRRARSPTAASTRCAGASRTRRSGHRGRKADPLYRIRKLLLSGYERLDERGHDRVLLGLRHGDPHDELLGAWLAKESVRDIYLTEDPKVARVLLDKAIVGCQERRGRRDPLARRHPRALEHRDLESPPHRSVQRSDRRSQPVREEGQALRTGLHLLRSLPTAGTSSRRWCHVAQASITAKDPSPHSNA